MAASAASPQRVEAAVDAALQARRSGDSATALSAAAAAAATVESRPSTTPPANDATSEEGEQDTAGAP